ncbi:splicing factor, proline- and glutamine-rich-like isoform X1 [Bos javanicus]|uniref:splicing factor, proline- and glutamine-rich-like isoform X1 n=2 Tax=Bos javanicus TaxID=9906 RepID=UPI002AA6F936|nr:splicing factor, proline- and glutamine-rich-like isoform X1 [Bos javanicus]
MAPQAPPSGNSELPSRSILSSPGYPDFRSQRPGGLRIHPQGLSAGGSAGLGGIPAHLVIPAGESPPPVPVTPGREFPPLESTRGRESPPIQEARQSPSAAQLGEPGSERALGAGACGPGQRGAGGGCGGNPPGRGRAGPGAPGIAPPVVAGEPRRGGSRQARQWHRRWRRRRQRRGDPPGGAWVRTREEQPPPSRVQVNGGVLAIPRTTKVDVDLHCVERQRMWRCERIQGRSPCHCWRNTSFPGPPHEPDWEINQAGTGRTLPSFPL